MKRVYYDVENTLALPFITGIQRVVREFSKIVLQSNNLSLKHQYIPVIFDHKHETWRRLSKRETFALLHDKTRSINLISKLQSRLIKLIPNNKLAMERFEPDSIFLDIESSWHSKVNRKTLLPKLANSGVLLAKVHYDIIPLLFPNTSHPNTVEVFTDHFISHLEHTDLFLCISNTTLQDVQQYCEQNGLPTPQLDCIQLGTTNPSQQSKSNAVLTSEITNKYGKYILSVGTLEPRKNYPLLIKAFNDIAETSELNLVIVGKTGWLAEQIIDKIHNHPLYNKRLFHLDAASDTSLDELYRQAWLNVVPSLYEGFGLPVIESLVRGCPTLCSNAGSLSEFNEQHVMFFSPESSKELSELISKIEKNKTLYETLMEAAQAFNPSSWQQTAQQIDDCLYTSLSKNP